MKRSSKGVMIVVLALVCAVVARADDEKKEEKLDSEVKDAIQLLKKTDPKMQSLFDSAHGYAVFPKVTKGAAGIGAAAGKGRVFEKGKLIGGVKLSQVTIGAQLGGQEFVEVIFFETEKALKDFTKGNFEMSAGVSAVAAAEGASANAKYRHGVLIFTVAKGGLMFEASVGGQKFEFTPLDTK